MKIECEWGGFVIDGKRHDKDGAGFGKDIRIVGEKVSEWKERKGHDLTAEMVGGGSFDGVDTLVIGNGHHGALTCPESVLQAICDGGIAREVIVLRTPQACEKYIELLRDGKNAAMLAHGTC